jgi:hypothetical protein
MHRSPDDISKLIPYLHNEHIANVYQIYSPYSKHVASISPPSKNKNPAYKVGDYQHYVSKNKKYNDVNGVNYNLHKVVPNRKLSPIGKKVMVKI